MRRHHADSSGPDSSRKLSDEACGKLMEIYVQEAEQYDKGLVQSWKDDMDVTLVFSGLYSAVLTAFVIESYQKLQEDPADASVVLLRQLVLLSNSSHIDINNEVPSDVFAPTSAALACNILWFMSLILALCCAFLATFVQQWSRQFIHKTGQLRSSTAHARLFSFLYFGLKNFRMHTFVNVIPSLLHLSLFSFLGGLIAFLRDVNPVLTYIIVVALTIVTTIYISFTILPLIALNSPYQTPFSPVVWKMWQTFKHGGLPIVQKGWQRLTRAVLPLIRSPFKTPQSIVSRALVYAPHAMIFPILPTLRYPHYPVRPPSIWHKFTALLASSFSSIRLLASSAYALFKILPHLPVVYDPNQIPIELPSEEVLEISLPAEKLHLSTWQRFRFLLKSWSAPLRLFPTSARTYLSARHSFLKTLPILPVVYEPPIQSPSSKVPETSPYPDKMLDLSDEVLAACQKPDLKRDVQCITWTLSSLTNDEELLPFIEALPYAIYGPNGIHDNNLHLIKPLVETADPEADIIHRITSLMTNASNSWFDKKHRDRCAIACPKALWALAFMFAERRDQFDLVKASRDSWFPEHILDALDDASRPAPGNNLDRKYPISAGLLCGIDSELTSHSAGRAAGQFLQASRELNPFEFERTSSALSKYLSTEMTFANSFSFSSKFFMPSPAGWNVVPQIDKETPLSPEQIAQLDVVIGLCLQLPTLPLGDVDAMLQYIHKRAETQGWGSTPRIWDICKSLRALNGRRVSRDFCNAMREYIYTQPVSFGTQNIDPLLLACVRKLAEPLLYASNENIDTSQIPLETMIAIRVVLADVPEEGAEAVKDFEVVRQYVEQNAFRLGAESWTWDDPRYGEDVKAGRVVLLTTRLLKRFSPSADEPVATNDILDALEFILFTGYVTDLFKIYPVESSLRAVGEELLVAFSQVTLDICERWTEKPSEPLTRNTLDIVAWMWQVWRFLKLPQSEEAIRNLAKAAELMLSPKSMGKIQECKSKEASRMPAPRQDIAEYLDDWHFQHRFDFKKVLHRYKNLQSDD